MRIQDFLLKLLEFLSVTGADARALDFFLIFRQDFFINRFGTIVITVLNLNTILIHYFLLSNMKLRPMGDRVIVKAVAREEVSKSGIILPDTVDKERPEQGEVIAVGPGRLLDNGTRAPMSVKIGDVVVFKKYSPDEVKIDGQEHLVIAESDILAVVE